ncbi:MAG: 50S ribosomal protein L30 [Chlorobi bacterium]|nr:50S ribosomal protein L30 [Chlorobiota bacterium]
MKKVVITKIRSTIKRPQSQKRTMEALGLRKIGQSREFELTPQIQGMINKVKHLVKVEEK